MPNDELAGECDEAEKPIGLEERRVRFNNKYKSLNRAQKEVMDVIKEYQEKVNNSTLIDLLETLILMIDGPGGSGKTYLSEVIIIFTNL